MKFTLTLSARAHARESPEMAPPEPTRRPELVRRSPTSYPRPLTARECATLERLARGKTQKVIAFENSINTVGNIAANAYRKLGVHGAAAAVNAHRDAHFLCGSRVRLRSRSGSHQGELEAPRGLMCSTQTARGSARGVSAPKVAQWMIDL
jgi:DNA-binding CsgD family transcriptional regulator